eukprot:scaffold435622_cov22-Prasinocladus_malaysianus.AAC.1
MVHKLECEYTALLEQSSILGLAIDSENLKILELSLALATGNVVPVARMSFSWPDDHALHA